MSRKNTKATNTQKVKTEKRNLPPIESVRYDYQHNENRRELLDLIRNQQLIANNPHWVVNVAMELVPEILASDKYYLTIDNSEIIAKCLTLTMKNFKMAHDPEQDFKAFFKKWEKMPELVDGYEELVGELYKAINDDYNSDDIPDSEYIGINQSDSMWVAMYITMSKGISLVLADTTLQFSASRSTKNMDDESEDGTEVETTDATSESESDTTAEDNVVEVVEGEVVDEFDTDSVDSNVKPDPVVIDVEVVSEEYSAELVNKLGQLLCKELYNDCRGSIDNILRLTISDDELMNTMQEISDKFLSSEFTKDQLESIEPHELISQVKGKFIARLCHELVSKAIPEPEHTREEQIRKGVEEYAEACPEIKDILTDDQLRKFVELCIDVQGDPQAVKDLVLGRNPKLVELMGNDLTKYFKLLALVDDNQVIDDGHTTTALTLIPTPNQTTPMVKSHMVTNRMIEKKSDKPVYHSPASYVPESIAACFR